MKKFFSNLLSALTLITCSLSAAAQTTSPVNILFDTDMGSDCDDAGAMAVLHRLADLGDVRVLGVIFSSGRNRYGVGVCDAINTYYGRGDLPLGQYHNDDVGDPIDRYSKRIAINRETYKHDLVDSAPEMLSVYKQVLRGQPDASVTIVTVGHPHGLSYLVDDDEGMELARRKVKRCVTMGGAPDAPGEEWNLCRPGLEKYVANVFKKWPTPHYFSPTGADIVTGNRKLPQTSVTNPVREAYLHYNGALTKGRSSWDQVAVLYAVRPELFKVKRGTLKQLPDFRIQWSPEVSDPPRYRVTPILTTDEMVQIFEDLMSAEPNR